MSKSSKDPKANSRCCVYDFTMFFPRDYLVDPESADYLKGIQQTREDLMKHCKKYCFQLEKGDKTGRYHLQGRFSLKEKRTMGDTIKLLNSERWEDYHLSITSSANRKNDFYVMKEKTRVAGPYTEEEYEEMPREVMDMIKLRPWQVTMIEILKQYDNRGINLIIDPRGGVGKSSLLKYLYFHKIGLPLLDVTDFRSVMRNAYCIGKSDIYVVDIERSTPRKALPEIFRALERLKIGICYDDRNTLKVRMQSNPNIVVFMNWEPDLKMLSQDRWRLWRISGSMKLKSWSEEKTYYDPDPIERGVKFDDTPPSDASSSYDSVDFFGSSEESSEELSNTTESSSTSNRPSKVRKTSKKK